MKMLVDTLQNKDAYEYCMKWRCWWIRYAMKMLMNMEWNKDADEYGMK